MSLSLCLCICVCPPPLSLSLCPVIYLYLSLYLSLDFSLCVNQTKCALLDELLNQNIIINQDPRSICDCVGYIRIETVANVNLPTQDSATRDWSEYSSSLFLLLQRWLKVGAQYSLFTKKASNRCEELHHGFRAILQEKERPECKSFARASVVCCAQLCTFFVVDISKLN